MWDLDGTLTDPGQGISRCIDHALTAMGLPVPDAEHLRRWIGPPLLHSFETYFDALGVNADPHRALSLYRERFSGPGMFENTLYPGTAMLLEHLKGRHHAMFLATAKPVVFAKPIVEHFRLGRWLDGVHGSELDGRRTDKVELLQFILDEEGLDASRCLMIGDREHDMLAARYHGMTAVGVLWGYGSRAELINAGAEHLVSKPQQLLAILDNMQDD